MPYRSSLLVGKEVTRPGECVSLDGVIASSSLKCLSQEGCFARKKLQKRSLIDR